MSPSRASGNTCGTGTCPGKRAIQEVVDERRRALERRLGHHRRGSDRLGAGKRLEELLDAESVVTVAVRDVDVRQVPIVGFDPVDELLILLDGQERVHHCGVTLAVDQRRGVDHPLEVFLSGRQVTGETWPTQAKRVVLQ